MSSSDSDNSSDHESKRATPKGLTRKRNSDNTDKDQKKGGSSTSSTSEDSDSSSDSESSPSTVDRIATGSESEAADEAPVLSHAAKRKLKKKVQKVAQGTDDNHGTQEPDKPIETKLRRQNSVWVGNLAFKTTEQGLRDFFSRHIPGCEITRVNMPGKAGQDVKGGGGMRGQNKGFAYIDFSTNEAKLKAIEASEQNLDGRRLLIKDGNDFVGRPGGSPTSGDGTKTKTARKILAAQKQPPAPTLFFGNLAFQVTEQSLQEMLERHRRPEKNGKDDNKEDQTGKQWIRKIRLGTFQDSGKCKGWAFVDFNLTEDATSALVNPKNHFLDGRKLVVEYASQEAVRRGGGKPQFHEKASVKHPEVPKRQKYDEKGDEQNLEEPVSKKMRLDRSPEQRRFRRAKPGAALAMAKRETAAIVPSERKKIVF